MQGKTRTGFEYNIDDRILTDWRFTIALTKCQNGKGMDQLAGAQEMVSLMLGEEGLERMMKHISDNNEGYVPAEAVMAEVQDIFESKIPKN
jgi:hypothetical protein